MIQYGPLKLKVTRCQGHIYVKLKRYIFYFKCFCEICVTWIVILESTLLDQYSILVKHSLIITKCAAIKKDVLHFRFTFAF